MFKTILIPATGSRSDGAALRTGLTVARLSGAHLDCLHVRPDPRQVLIQAAGYDMGSGIVMADVMETMLKEDERRAATARAAFEAFRTRENIPVAQTPPGPGGVSAAWSEKVGDPESLLLAATRLNDLAVFEQGAGGHNFPRETVGRILINGGRPLLLAPPAAPQKLPGTVAIAWKNAPEAARAVGAAMPLISRAEKVIVLTAEESEQTTAEAAEGLAAHLRWHGLDAQARFLVAGGSSTTEMVLAGAREAKADLLVMGGYGRSRISELIFGGLTRDILGGAPIPVLLAH
jgi:nucleotide-binding universal stress UspA family protein